MFIPSDTHDFSLILSSFDSEGKGDRAQSYSRDDILYICQRTYSAKRDHISLPPIAYWKGKIIAYKWIEAKDQMNGDEHEHV